MAVPAAEYPQVGRTLAGPGLAGYRTGPPDTGMAVYPRTGGGDGRWRGFTAGSVNFGRNPQAHVSREIGNVPITMPFNFACYSYEWLQQLVPGTILFAVREQLGPASYQTLIFSLAQLNKLAVDQWNDFVLRSEDGVNPYADEEAILFRRYLTEYGESGLEAYEMARLHGETPENRDFLRMPELRHFHELAQTPGYCYLTRFGWVSRVNFLGIADNVSRATTLEKEMAIYEYEENTLSGGVALAKRTKACNVFGSSEETRTGANVWIILTRIQCDRDNGASGAFQLRPGANAYRNYPLEREYEYIDEAGMMRRGFYWHLGYVLRSGPRSPQRSVLEAANGTGSGANPHVSYEMHGLLPTLELALEICN